MFTPPTQVEYLDARCLISFPNHPFKVSADQDLADLYDSIYANGVTSPLLIWEREPGEYIILSGHRRNTVCLLIWQNTGDETYLTVPVLIYRGITQDEATLIMVDENAHRERILPSEKAKAYKMKLEALKRIPGKRYDENGAPLVPRPDHMKTRDIIGGENGESREQVRRYIRLTYLIPTLLKMVDEDHLGFRAGVEISYLNPDQQEILAQAMETLDTTPNLKQAQKLKAAHQDGKLTDDEIVRILKEETLVNKVSFRIKPEQKDRLDKLCDNGDITRSEALRILTETATPVYLGKDMLGEVHDLMLAISQSTNWMKMRQNRLDLITYNPLLAEKDKEAFQIALDDQTQLRKEMDICQNTLFKLCKRIERELDELNAGGRKPS